MVKGTFCMTDAQICSVLPPTTLYNTKITGFSVQHTCKEKPASKNSCLAWNFFLNKNRIKPTKIPRDFQDKRTTADASNKQIELKFSQICYFMHTWDTPSEKTLDVVYMVLALWNIFLTQTWQVAIALLMTSFRIDFLLFWNVFLLHYKICILCMDNEYQCVVIGPEFVRMNIHRW